MAIKKGYFIILLIFALGCTAFGQTSQPPQANLQEAVPAGDGKVDTSDASSYFIRETEEGVRFIQKIEWEPVSNILRYVIVVDQRYGNSDRYNEVVRESTENNFIELTIPPGNYRYKVEVYNLLNRLDGESDYLYFEVFRAVQPMIKEITPHNLYLDEDQPRRVTLIGDNFVLGSKIYLVPIREGISDNSETQRGVLVPADLKYSDVGDTVELVFNEQDLDINHFRIVVVNPGGLTSTYEALDIKFQKPLDINVSAGYAPLLPLFSGNSTDSDLKTVLDTPFYPLGFTLKASVVPYKRAFGYFGLELSPFYNFVKADRSAYILQTNILGASVSFLYQKPFLGKKLFLNARIGGGVGAYTNMYFDYKNGIESDPLSTWFPLGTLGVSGQYFVFKKAFVELGLDLKVLFATEMTIGYLSPVLTAGWQF